MIRAQKQLFKIPKFQHAPCWFVPRYPLLSVTTLLGTPVQQLFNANISTNRVAAVQRKTAVRLSSVQIRMRSK